MRYTHVFFDIGGVLGTNGWDHEQRDAAIEQFGLSREEFEYRHREAVGLWEEGRMSIDAYLDVTVFYQDRPFTREAFVEHMRSLSQPNVGSIAIVSELVMENRVRLMTMNNEAEE